jgi:hypothetical protein
VTELNALQDDAAAEDLGALRLELAQASVRRAEARRAWRRLWLGAYGAACLGVLAGGLARLALPLGS